MKDGSKTSGVPWHENPIHGHPDPAPGGSSNEDEAATETDTTLPPRYTLKFLIQVIKQLREKDSRDHNA